MHDVDHIHRCHDVGDLRVGRIELCLQLRNLHLKILDRLFGCTGEFADKLLARDFQLIELVVEDGEARPAFRLLVLDLLHEACLLRLDGRKLDRQFLSSGGGALQPARLVGYHFLGNAVEDVEGVEGDGQAVEDALFEFIAGDRLAVAAACATEVIDR
ncbi:hypothetical protein [Agrobacterium tumefaciens]|uniref:hypothetical protein n=1 Tax=Agrobacterium tumefaciens TaxID=358 RepID=UPI001E594291|nr:hypothetical protein [Agrobacterium tumefaciens]